MTHIKSPDRWRDRRRFKTTTAPTGKARVKLKSEEAVSIFPNYVKTWTFDTKETILKDGAHNRKIGGDVLVGDLRGAYLVTLSLEERATCPTSCTMWLKCYGNNMNRNRRWHYTPELLIGLENELNVLCHRYPGVLVRLHVLGDFPTIDYLEFWERMLQRHANLFCFGFTAHLPETVGGELVKRLRDAYPGPFAVRSRFAIRHSGVAGEWGSQVIHDCPADTNTDLVVCPEQLDSVDDNARQKHCGTCAVCWQSSCNIQFLEH